MKEYVSQLMTHPCFKSCSGEDFMLVGTYFAVVVEYPWIHMHPQILIVETTCAVEMPRLGWRIMAAIRPCMWLPCVARW